MSFIGIFTRNETVRAWCNYTDLGGSPIVPTNPTIKLYQGNVEIVSATPTQFAVGSNLYYYDYTVADAPTEGDIFVVWSGEYEGVEGQSHDYFKIDLMKDHVLENRLGNMRLRFFPATSSNATRKTVPGVLDYQIIETKWDDDPADWSVIRTTKTLYFWYESDGDHNPILVGESD